METGRNMSKANVDIDSAFQGIENAVVRETSPKVPAYCKGRGKVVRFDVFESENKSGLCAAIEFDVLESNNEACRVGVVHGKVITDLLSSDKGKRGKKQGQLVQAIAAFMGKDHSDPALRANLTKLIKYGRDKGAFDGKIFRFETGAEAKSDGGFTYIPFHFRLDGEAE